MFRAHTPLRCMQQAAEAEEAVQHSAMHTMMNLPREIHSLLCPPATPPVCSLHPAAWPVRLRCRRPSYYPLSHCCLPPAALAAHHHCCSCCCRCCCRWQAARLLPATRLAVPLARLPLHHPAPLLHPLPHLPLPLLQAPQQQARHPVSPLLPPHPPLPLHAALPPLLPLLPAASPQMRSAAWRCQNRSASGAPPRPAAGFPASGRGAPACGTQLQRGG